MKRKRESWEGRRGVGEEKREGGMHVEEGREKGNSFEENI